MQFTSQAKKYQIQELLAEGLSHSEIADKVGTSKVYVGQVRSKYKSQKSNFVPVVLQSQAIQQRECAAEWLDPIWIGQVIGTVLKQLK